MRRLALPLAVVCTLLMPASASGATIAAKCHALVTELNVRRSPNVRLRAILCDIAHARSIQQARAGRMFHNIAYVTRRLTRAGVCYRNVGEVVAYTTRTPSASRYLSMWWNSTTHRAVLSASRYDRAGGSWRASSNGATYATMLVLDSC
jgi:uncharacterized protein YkwD